MDNDAFPPSSPPLHLTYTNAPSPPFFETHATPYLKSSSPPPLFSSDDSRESIDVGNYDMPRINKGKRKGAWWDKGQAVANDREPKKTKMSRNYDSGVYMMSDASDGVEDLLQEHKPPFAEESTAFKENPRTQVSQTVLSRALFRGLQTNKENWALDGLALVDADLDELASIATIIKDVPDPGNEVPAEAQYRSFVPEINLFLNDNSLRLLNPTLFNLDNLTYLNLRNNNIEELPPQVNRLRNLTRLDVSHNPLSWLPLEIIQMLTPHGSLQGIVTFNNPLMEWLKRDGTQALHPDNWPQLNNRPASTQHSIWREAAPSSLAESLYDSLGTSDSIDATAWKIRIAESFTNWPGQLLPSEDGQEVTLKNQGLYRHHPVRYNPATYQEATTFMARTQVVYYDQAGAIVRGSPVLSSGTSPIIVDTNRGSINVPSSEWFCPPKRGLVASLLTTSMHNAFRARHNSDLSLEALRELIPDTCGTDKDKILEQAIQNHAFGFGEFRSCHTCGKEYVIPRATWGEFWAFQRKLCYPVQVKVCSWACVPEEFARRPNGLEF